MLRDTFRYDGVWNGDDLFHRVPKPRERFRAFDHFRVRLHGLQSSAFLNLTRIGIFPYYPPIVPKWIC